ncbi:MAG: hypothetical protein LC799_29600 [Actinobacteria bacterium]|nr:hypothetical protein [Actinomycetota bacterium]
MTTQLLTATTGPDPDLTRILTLAILAWLGWRLLLIALFPFTACRACRRRGRFQRGNYWRPCHRCSGSARRLRLGRRVWQWVTRDKERT